MWATPSRKSLIISSNVIQYSISNIVQVGEMAKMCPPYKEASCENSKPMLQIKIIITFVTLSSFFIVSQRRQQAYRMKP